MQNIGSNYGVKIRLSSADEVFMEMISKKGLEGFSR